MGDPTPPPTSASPLPAPTPASLPPVPPASGAPPFVCHKSLLHQYAQKSSLPLPMYQTINLGLPHAPQFKATVVVGGETFESSAAFLHVKEAEQDAARAALEGISLNLKTRGLPIIKNDTTFCKSILFEYAVKTKLEKPVYTTAISAGLFPLFITTVVFDGKAYVGEKAKNKKEAEQIGARAAIDAILGSDKGTIMLQIINAKGRLYAALGKNNVSSSVQDTDAGLRGRVDADIIPNAKEMQSAATNDKPSSVAYEEHLSSGQPANTSSVIPIPLGAKKPKEEVNELSELGGTGTSLSALQQIDPSTAANEFQGTPSSSGRKRKNNKKKSRSKKARTDEQPPVYVETVAQGVA